MTETPEKTITVARYTDADVTMPDGVALPLRVRAFTHPELSEFMQGFQRIERPLSARAFFRRDGEDELPMPLVRAKRLAEMTAAQSEAHRKAEADDAEFLLTFSAQQVATFVRLQPGVVLVAEGADGATKQVRTGPELAEMYAGDPEALATITRAIAEENTLSLEKKRRSRSRSALIRSSSTSPAEQPGPTPAATAPSAEPPPAFASPAAASVDQGSTPSGETV